MNQLINSIREDLISNANEKTRIQGEKYFKENIKIYGLKSAQVEKISKEYYNTIADKSKTNIFSLCEELWQSGFIEEAGIACMWSYNVRKEYYATYSLKVCD